MARSSTATTATPSARPGSISPPSCPPRRGADPDPLASAAQDLAAALDDWAAVRRSKRSDFAGAARLSEAARVADPDPWRVELRTVLDRPDKTARLDGLRALARTAKFEELGAISLHLLGAGLNDAGDGALAESVLRTGPAAASARRLGQPHAGGDTGEAVSPRRGDPLLYRRPGDPARDGLQSGAQPREARRLRRGPCRVPRPQGVRPSTRNLNFLSGFLRDKKGLYQDAEAMSRAAEAAGREAIRLRPDDAVAHHDLANALNGEESLAEFRTAIRLKPDSAPMRFNLGLRLEQLGRHAKAETELRGAIRAKPDFAEAYGLLGGILLAQGKLDDAIAEYRDVNPAQARPRRAHRSLGLALPRQGKLDEAIAELRLTTLLQPSYAEAHCDLGGLLKQEGDYAGALDMYRKGHELGSRRADWPKESVQWVAEAERELALSTRFPAMIRGEDRPRDDVERLTLAQMSFDRKLFAAAGRHWSEGCRTTPSYATTARQGSPTAPPSLQPSPASDSARMNLRPMARRERSCAVRPSKGSRPNSPPGPGSLKPTLLRHAQTVARDLTRWKQDRDLTVIRDSETLARLPEAERKEWQALWAEVDSLLKHATAP